MENLRTINTTLVLLMKDGMVLLGEKKRGFAKGTLNGIGGKQDPGETIEQAMIRETQEEIGVTPIEYELLGKIHFDVWYKGERVNMFLNIYSSTVFEGVPVETEEMIPNWFEKDKIPFEKMLADDKLWMPYALQGKKFVGDVQFDKELNPLKQSFKEVKDFENCM